MPEEESAERGGLKEGRTNTPSAFRAGVVDVVAASSRRGSCGDNVANVRLLPMPNTQLPMRHESHAEGAEYSEFWVRGALRPLRSLRRCVRIRGGWANVANVQMSK